MSTRFGQFANSVSATAGRFLKDQRSNGCSTEGGVTILECLVAIMLIGVTVAMVSPPLVIAAATRIQNRRAEQAMQLAQDEIDRINTLVQQGRHESRRLPKSVGNVTNLKGVAAPSKVFGELKTTRLKDSTCPGGSPYSGSPRYVNAQVPETNALPVDVDGDCKPEFFMQVFRTVGQEIAGELQKADPTTRRPAQFELGIRVYSTLAQANLVSGKLKNPVESAPLTITGGQGKQATNPLVAVYKTLYWSEEADTLCSSLDPADAEKMLACQSPSP